MKRIILLVFVTSFLSGLSIVKSQAPSIREEINHINSLLRENPYTDTFLEITFFYSIDITPEKELVVKMDFDGPFSTTTKASIPDLDQTQRIDTALQGTSSVCWYCKADTTKRAASCVYNGSVTKKGDKESHYNDNICVMISRKSAIRDELIKAFDHLFKSVIKE